MPAGGVCLKNEGPALGAQPQRAPSGRSRDASFCRKENQDIESSAEPWESSALLRIWNLRTKVGEPVDWGCCQSRGAAMSSCVLPRKLLRCSLCAGTLARPVTAPCGHTFCRGCLEGYWGSRAAPDCPACGRAFPVRPELGVNGLLQDILDRVGGAGVGGKEKKEEEEEEEEEEVALGPGAVPCDFCTARPAAARRTCLLCLASYCETHLGVHEARFPRHRLARPLARPEERLCGEHERPLEMFCRTDGACVCFLCAREEHGGHEAVPVETEWGEKKIQLQNIEADIQRMIQERHRKMEEIKVSIRDIKSSARRALEESNRVFAQLLRSVEQSHEEVMEQIEEKHIAAEEHAEELLGDLEREISALRQRSSDLEQLAHTEDLIHFLKTFPDISALPETSDWSQVTVQTDLFLGTVRRAVSGLMEKVQKTLDDIYAREVEKIQIYAADVTVDAKTAHPGLVLSADGKRISHGDKPKPLLQNPERFDRAVAALGREGFASGKHYWEVDVGAKTDWDLGVAGESAKRKGEVRVAPGDGYWHVAYFDDVACVAVTEPLTFLSLRDKPRRVGVYLDYEEGELSFYNAEDRAHIFTFKDDFAEKLYPLFSPGLNLGGQNAAPMIICSTD
ncbi:E3 ubiquitin-protein ligase TRIM39-like [Lepisosteus oculatus]|uniref:E3 ubiquitin-protein ligase TRIM39-like n=1 Tax=Lepisosteus oculatus TaxID=7918 RepID=UPI0037201501